MEEKVDILQSNRLVWLDELRGLAALMVMLGHYSSCFKGVPFILTLLEIFPRGVQLFYILSGYVLFKLYAGKISSCKSYGEFLLKRFFRIAPAFYLMILICSLIFNPPNEWLNLGLHILILPFGFFHHFLDSLVGIEWSVFVECWFYILFPILILFRHKLPFLLMICCFVAFIQTILIYLSGAGVDVRTFWYKMPDTQMMFFVTGFLLASYHSSNKHSNKSLEQTACYLGFLGLMIIPFILKPFTLQLYLAWPLLALMLNGYDYIKRPKWISNALDWAGKRSYSIYLIHWPLLRLLEGNHRITPNCLAYLGLITLTMIISDLSWKFIEIPGIETGRKLLKQKT